MNMMNMNWREAIKQAQQKIDKVLDIRSEDDESIVGQTNSSSLQVDNDIVDEQIEENTPSSISPKSDEEEQSVVMFEPVMPPNSHGLVSGDDIQTIVSSDIEILPEVPTPNLSPPIRSDIDLPDLNEILGNNKWLKEKLESEQKKLIELREQNAKLSAKSSTIEKNFESFKSEANKFSQEAFKARQDAKASRAKIAELTKDMEILEEKLNARDTKIKGMKSAMEDNLAIVKKYTTSNSTQAENIKKLNDEILEKSCRIQELEAVIESFENKKQDEETGTMYLDDMLEQTMSGLRTEVEEYRKNNFNLQENVKKLEQEIEQKQCEYENKLTEAVSAAGLNSVHEINNLKYDYDVLVAEKKELEIKESITASSLEKLQRLTKKSKDEMRGMKELVKSLVHFVNQEHSRSLHEINRAISHVARNNNETRRKLIAEALLTAKPIIQMKDVQDKSLQTDKLPEVTQTESEASQPEIFTDSKETCWCSTLKDRKYVANISDMIKMIDELSFQRDQLETTKRTADLELKETRKQLSEVLIMHGEKIEELEELRIDNEDLRGILKEQALSLTEPNNELG